MLSRTSKPLTKVEKKLTVTVTVLLLVVFTLCVMLYFVIARNSSDSSAGGSNVCVSETCVKAANFLLNFPNSSYACGDFASDTCSIWNETRPPFIPNIEKTQLTIDKEIREMLETTNKNSVQSSSSRNLFKFYQDCKVFDKLDEGHLYWLRTFLRDLGGWPLIEEQWSGLYYDWIYAIGKAANMAGIDLFISVSTQPDDDDSRRNILRIAKPESSIDIASINYLNAVRELATLAGATDDATLRTHIDNIKIVDKIISIPKSGDSGEKLTLEELQRRLPSIEWLTLIQVMTNSTFNPCNFSLRSDELVVLKDKEYFVNMNEIFENRLINKRILANYIGANSALTLLRWIYKPFKLQDFFYDHPLRVHGFGSTSTYYCIQLVRNAMPFALDHLLAFYQHLDQNNDEQINSYLMKAMRYIILKMKNLSATKMDAILSKLDDLVILNNAPDWIFKQDFIDNLYKQIPELNFHILDSTSKILSNAFMSPFRRLTEKNSRNRWPTTVSITDHRISYNPHYNSMVIPGFLWHSPLFTLNYPSYMNFASAGAIIGHKLIMEFLKINVDKLKSQDDNHNGIKSEKMIENLLTEYKNFNLPTPDYQIPEIFDDSSGIRLSYLAYKLWEQEHTPAKTLPGVDYSVDQLFFIFHGLTRCNSQDSEDYHARLNENVQRMKEFLDAFHCSNI